MRHLKEGNFRSVSYRHHPAGWSLTPIRASLNYEQLNLWGAPALKGRGWVAARDGYLCGLTANLPVPAKGSDLTAWVFKNDVVTDIMVTIKEGERTACFNDGELEYPAGTVFDVRVSTGPHWSAVNADVIVSIEVEEDE